MLPRFKKSDRVQLELLEPWAVQSSVNHWNDGKETSQPWKPVKNSGPVSVDQQHLQVSTDLISLFLFLLVKL